MNKYRGWILLQCLFVANGWMVSLVLSDVYMAGPGVVCFVTDCFAFNCFVIYLCFVIYSLFYVLCFFTLHGWLTASPSVTQRGQDQDDRGLTMPPGIHGSSLLHCIFAVVLLIYPPCTAQARSENGVLEFYQNRVGYLKNVGYWIVLEEYCAGWRAP